ncbi:hypothetical protein [Phormidium nigroviride]|uniref:hypothetical protein n=1 Tax=Phormidium nigroviride TaxID=482564 RepID=UPI00167F2C86|nr:hypothetical protein [Oscillatoria nigro-viridis]
MLTVVIRGEWETDFGDRQIRLKPASIAFFRVRRPRYTLSCGVHTDIPWRHGTTPYPYCGQLRIAILAIALQM